MKKNKLILGLIFLIGSTSCKSVDETTNLGSFLIFYQKSNSWIEYSYNANIDQNGKLSITEKSFVTNLSRESEIDLPKEDLLSLKEKLNDLIAIELNENYGFDNDIAPTDYPTIYIEYVTKNKTASTYVYGYDFIELPRELDSFLRAIEQVLLENDTIKNL